MANIQAYKPMYKVRPYFVIKKVKLPDCMYLIKPLHNLPSIGGDDERADNQRALEMLELRQENIFSRINELRQKIEAAGAKYGLTREDLQGCVETYVPSDTPIDVVISCPPSMPPYPLLALYQYICPLVPTAMKSFVHCSVKETIQPGMVALFSKPLDDAKLKITIIWKEGNAPEMVVSPNKQVPVKGICNICRYISRQFCRELYENQDPVKTSQIDSWLDLVTFSYLCGNAKEKASVLRNMNASLGTSSFLIGDQLSLADIVLYAIVGGGGEGKLGSNVKAWIKRCRGMSQLNQIPCAYLE